MYLLQGQHIPVQILKLRVKILKEYLSTIFLMISYESALVNGYAMNKKINSHKYFQFFDFLPNPSSLGILELISALKATCVIKGKIYAKTQKSISISFF